MERKIIVWLLMVLLIVSGCASLRAACPRDSIVLGTMVMTPFGVSPGEVFIEQGWLDDPEHYMTVPEYKQAIEDYRKKQLEEYQNQRELKKQNGPPPSSGPTIEAAK